MKFLDENIPIPETHILLYGNIHRNGFREKAPKPVNVSVKLLTDTVILNIQNFAYKILSDSYCFYSV